jgi:hypothetical protein
MYNRKGDNKKCMKNCVGKLLGKPSQGRRMKKIKDKGKVVPAL